MDFSGMTLNERLAMSGLLDEFEKAKKAKNTQRLVQILQEVEVDEKTIESYVKKRSFFQRLFGIWT
jgi:hypothetical protein